MVVVVDGEVAERAAIIESFLSPLHLPSLLLLQSERERERGWIVLSPLGGDGERENELDFLSFRLLLRVPQSQPINYYHVWEVWIQSQVDLLLPNTVLVVITRSPFQSLHQWTYLSFGRGVIGVLLGLWSPHQPQRLLFAFPMLTSDVIVSTISPCTTYQFDNAS